MDEKTAAMSPIAGSPTARRHRSILAVAVLGAICLYAFIHLQQLCGLPSRPAESRPWTQDATVQTNGKLVPLEAHIMSKCPDARASPSISQMQ
jgi:hypothetical protein